MSNNSDIGWLDKSKVDATLRKLKERKHPRRRSADKATSSQDEQHEEFVDLFGAPQPTPETPKSSENQSYVIAPESVADNPAPAPHHDATVAAPAARPDTAQTTSSTASEQTVAAEEPAPRRSTTPTAKLGITPDIPDEYTDPVAEAQLTPTPHASARPTTQEAPPQPDSTRPPNQLTATLETTPVSAYELGEETEPSEDLSERFKDAFDVLRTSDPSHPSHRTVTAEIRPSLHDHELRSHDELSIPQPPAPSRDRSQDLSLQSTGADNTPQASRADDLQLHAAEPSTPFQQQRTPFDDDDALSLPAHDLDLSIKTRPTAASAFEPTLPTEQPSEDLVFEAGDFHDDLTTGPNLATQNPETKNLATKHLEDMLLPEVEQHDIEPPSKTTSDVTQLGDTQPIERPTDDAQDYTRPEHAFVPKIHSQILKTVRLRNAPDPSDFETLYLWLQAVHTWIKSTETSATKFLVADHAGLSLLETDIDDDTVARAVATRRSMVELNHAVDQNDSGFTVFRQKEDAYMNLVWAPSDHGIITVGILSDHVYPDDRLSTLEEKLVRGIDTLPFI